MEPRPSLTHSQEKHMTHVLRAHGLLPTAIEAVGRMQVNLVDDLRGPDATEAFNWLQEVDALCNKLDRGHCLGTEDRGMLINCVIARKAALNVVNPGALAQRVMDDCDKIIELIG